MIIEKNFTILDVGCGGGKTVGKLAAMASEGKICGIDYARGSVAVASGKNAQLIRAGRVKIELASVSRLPFPDDQFDLVTAIETQYYWPDPVNDMQEIRRVLKPGGMLVIIVESYKSDKSNKIQQMAMKLLSSTLLSVDEQQELFSKAGYTNLEIFEENKKGWFCGIGRKP